LDFNQSINQSISPSVSQSISQLVNKPLFQAEPVANKVFSIVQMQITPRILPKPSQLFVVQTSLFRCNLLQQSVTG